MPGMESAGSQPFIKAKTGAADRSQPAPEGTIPITNMTALR